MDRTRFTALALVVLLVAGGGLALLGGNGGVPDDEPQLPRSMAAIGDSITRAAAADPSTPLDSPRFSWATGEQAYSHRTRLAAVGATFESEGVHNVAVSGARMADAPSQARVVVDQEADYVTFLMGANDVCFEDMTSVTDFRGNFFATLNILFSRLPDSHLFVASIPDIGHLWTLFGDDHGVTQLWETLEVCPTILSTDVDQATREEALDRLRDFNRVLEEGCGATARCTFDDGAVFDHRFDRAHVSTLDHFHPSVRGQEILAEITWRAGPWFDE